MNHAAESPALLKPVDIDVDEVLEGLLEWVAIETPSSRPEQISKLLDIAERDIAGSPIERRRVPGRDGHGDHLVLTYNPAGSNAARALVMGHVDTVWPIGTLERRPIRTDGDRLYGPGIYDMKAGSYLAYHAIRLLGQCGAVPPRPVVVLLNSDEEIGSPTSRALIEELAATAAFVLVPEPAVGPDTAAVTSRKGWGRFTMTAHGRPAHAGGNLAEGRSAIREIARHILDLEALTDLETGTTVNVGVVSGGTLLNMVPARAHIEIDLRVADEEAGQRLTDAILSRRPFDPDVRLEIEGGINRPPFRREPGIERLFRAAAELAGDLGFDLPETTRGGVSDGNFSAALGRPTLDGLGCGGHGAHAEDEHIRVSTIAPRAALIYDMLVSIDFQNNAVGKTS
jgi:glutamate carboxypeptidase